MKDLHLNKHLNKQINKFLTEEVIAKTPGLISFIDAVNQTYKNYEKDTDLFEQSMVLNDLEYLRITNRLKKSQENLEKAKNASEKATVEKSEFLSIMTHEIRTPLNAIIGLLYIMQKENSLQCFRENIEVLTQSSKNLFLLINNILDFNKIEAGKIELEKSPFHIITLVNQIANSLQARASENGTVIEVIHDKNFEPNVISDSLRFNQIITNLVSNAVKFTQNGVVKIKLNQLSLMDKHTTFRVEIIDNGIGIDKNKFTDIFQKFSQANSKTTKQFGGSGLGLLIVKKLLNLLDSDIHYESEIGVGSNFYFNLKLPIVTNPKFLNEGKFMEEYEEKDLSGLKVLLVEDNLINIKIIQKILDRWGVIVEVAENGLVGVEKFNNAIYDLVLMDLYMPIMSGYEATATMRKYDKITPIIAITASVLTSREIENAKAIGFNEYIIKPLSPKDLNSKLYKYHKSKLIKGL